MRERRGCWLGFLGTLAVVGLVVAGMASWARGPGPGSDALAPEPALVAPIPARELTRETREPSRGWGVGPDLDAFVSVEYLVDATPEQAVEAWREAYADEYAFRYRRQGPSLWVTEDDRWVQVAALADVEVERLLGPRDPAEDPEAPGPTVIRVTVMASND